MIITKNFTLKDKAPFEKYLLSNARNLSKYNFASLFLDKALFKVVWAKIGKSICVFAQQKSSCYMILAPLGRFNDAVLDECFRFMDKYNGNSAISRIENVDSHQVKELKKHGLIIKEGFNEYFYKRKDLVRLSGNKFKSKRASYNFFIKNYPAKTEKFEPKHASDCLKLYKNWSAGRKFNNNDSIYQSMLDENFAVHKLAMENYRALNLHGIVVRINSKIVAYSLGYKLNPNTFCIFCEVADLTKKGIAQFVFKKMCAARKEKFINAMDDSGFESLKRTKLSYHPFKLIFSYRAYRNLDG